MSRRISAQTPIGIRCAIAIAVCFLLLHWLGLRDWVSVVSGTPVPNVPHETVWLGGTLYVIAWLSLTLVAPILVLTSLFHALLQRWYLKDREQNKRP